MKHLLIILTLISSTALAQENPMPDTKQAPSKLGYFGLAIEYSSANSIKAPYTIISDSTGTLGTGNITASSNTAMTITADYSFITSKNSEFNLGLSYDSERTISGLSFIQDSGSPITVVARKDSFTLLSLGANGVYHLRDSPNLSAAHIFGGLNVTNATLSPVSGSCSTGSGLGAQLGVGNSFSENVVGEYYYRVVSANISCSSGGVKIDYQRVTIEGLQLRLKYLFK